MALKVLKRARILIDLGPLLLSHHAFCKKFSDHVIKAGPIRICLGCVSIYPAFIVAAAALLLLNGRIENAFPPWCFLFIGIPFVMLRFIPIDKRGVHTLFNAGTGAGTGMMFVGLMLFPAHWALRLLALTGLAFLASYLYFRRFRRHLEVCDKVCRYRRDWSRCPGFKKIYSKIERDLQ
jgi:hypothetical protein